MPGLDRIAIFLSGLCLVHCLALPLGFLLTPVLAQWLVTSETMAHWVLLGSAIPVSAWALGRGFSHHHDKATVLLGIVGLSLMLVGVAHWFGEGLETPLTIGGVLLLLWAHLRNVTVQHDHEG